MLHGHELKQAILEIIYERFADWSQPFAFACRRGCAHCCTQNVTVTAVEAQILLDYAAAHDIRHRLVAELSPLVPGNRESLTTNEFAGLCMDGSEPVESERGADAVCPFLINDECMVYPARPFACRCFASTAVCRHGKSAVVPPEYLSAAAAVSQIIEHVAQFNIWGNMLNVLYVLGCETGVIGPESDDATLVSARERCTTAQPLPGFLLDETEYEQIAPLLESIFAATVDGRCVEDILNNR